MKVGICSDSHDNLDMLAEAVEVFRNEGIAYLLHAGDFISPFTSRPFQSLGIPFHGVFGNNDGERFGLRNAFEKIGSLHERFFEGELDGKKIIMVHEPYHIQDLESSGRYDLVIYGHTHEMMLRKVGNTIVVNPGEIYGKLSGKSTIAIWDTETMAVEMKELVEE